jgi:hypothetical protein
MSWQQMMAVMPEYSSTINIYPYKYNDEYDWIYKNAYKKFFTKAGDKAH